MALYLEELGESVEGYIVALAVCGHGQVDVAGAQLHADLLIDHLLHLLAVVLPDPALAVGRRHLGTAAPRGAETVVSFFKKIFYTADTSSL